MWVFSRKVIKFHMSWMDRSSWYSAELSWVSPHSPVNLCYRRTLTDFFSAGSETGVCHARSPVAYRVCWHLNICVIYKYIYVLIDCLKSITLTVHNCIHNILQLSHTCEVYVQLLERTGLALSVQACNAKSMYLTSAWLGYIVIMYIIIILYLLIL